MEPKENRELRITRIFKAPIALLWEVWTNPKHLVNWWGPNGFTNTIHTMEVREGGEWKLTMHGPDGTNFPNRSVFREVIPHEKIVYEHFNPHFITTVRFESRGDETYMEWSMEFDTTEMRDIVIRAHKADDGLKQNVEKLERYLSGLQDISDPAKQE